MAFDKALRQEEIEESESEAEGEEEKGTAERETDSEVFKYIVCSSYLIPFACLVENFMISTINEVNFH